MNDIEYRYRYRMHTIGKKIENTSTSATPLHYTKVDIFSILTHLRLPSVTSKSASKKSEYSENGQ